MTNRHEGLPIEGITGIDSFRSWVAGFRTRAIEHCPSERMVERPNPYQQDGTYDVGYTVVVPLEPWQLFPPRIGERLKRHYTMLEAKELRVGLRIDRTKIEFSGEVNPTDANPGEFDLINNFSPLLTLGLYLEEYVDMSPGEWYMQEIPILDRYILEEFAQQVTFPADVSLQQKDWIDNHFSQWIKREPAHVDEMREVARFLKGKAEDVSVEKYFMIRYKS